MTVTNVATNFDTLTLSITAEFDAEREAVWQLSADPRKLERWWGPPTYPATFTEHNLTAGGAMAYLMTGPEGDQHHGWWKITTVDEPNTIEFADGFADANGAVNPELPVTQARFEFSDIDGGGTRLSITSRFASLEGMQQVVAMGMEEGMTLAMGQMDGILMSS